MVLLACSQIGLHYNGPALTLDPETEFNGRHFLGLGHYFFKYPARLIYVEFSESADGGSRNHKINLWTRDGQEVFVRPAGRAGRVRVGSRRVVCRCSRQCHVRAMCRLRSDSTTGSFRRS